MNDVIEALERAAVLADVAMIDASLPMLRAEYEAAAATIRQHIANLRAGKLVRQEDVDARVVAWLREFAGELEGAGDATSLLQAEAIVEIADAIAAGSHMNEAIASGAHLVSEVE